MGVKIYLLTLIIMTAALTPAAASKGDSQRPPTVTRAQVRAVRLNSPITVDGALSEPVWQNEFGISDFTQRDPKEGEPPSERTVVRVAYDDQAIYVGARMYDSDPKKIIARLGRRDADLNSDAFTFYVDPYHDRRSGFFFTLTAAGTFSDGVLNNDNWRDHSWDGVWEGKAKIDDQGWTAEMRIPYSQLRFHRQSEEQLVWGINFQRTVARKNEEDYLVFTPKNGSGFVSRFVDLVGIENIKPPRRLEILPYVTARIEFTQRQPGDPFNDGSKLSSAVGSDFKVGFGSNLTLDATANPDFGQVEVDPAVVNLTDVETFFEEKRPFFIEGSSIFQFGHGGASSFWGFNWGDPDFFYTRRIGRAPQGSVPTADFVDIPTGTHILGAGKLSGKIGSRWNVGMLSALTSRETAELDQSGQRFQLEVEPPTYYGVFRGQREYQESRQGLGFISTLTKRHFTDDRLKDEINGGAFTFGVDGWKFLDANKTWVVTGWLGMSRVTGTEGRITALQQDSQHYFQRPDAGHVHVDPNATSLTGYAGRVYLNKEKGNFFLNSAFGFIDPKFDVNDLGIMFRSDVINWHVGAGYRWTKPRRYARSSEIIFSTFRSYDFDGNRIWAGYFALGDIEFPNYYRLQSVFAYNPQTIDNRQTRGGPLMLHPPGRESSISVDSDHRKAWVFGFGVDRWIYGADSSVGWGMGPRLEWKPASNVSLSVRPSFDRSLRGAQWIGIFDSPSATATFGKRYVFARLQQTSLSAGIRLNWTFTPRISLQFYGQPLISAGDYHDFKELARPKSYLFNHYGQGGSTFSETTFVADPDGPGPAEPIQLPNPNFNFKSLRANAVWRWEYRPGSTFYAVWTQSRSDSENVGAFRLGHSLGRLWDTKSDNIFLVKLTFWENR